LKLISGEERDRFFDTFEHEALHLEMRDVYATDVERTDFMAWLRASRSIHRLKASGGGRGSSSCIRTNKQGKTLKRLRIVSEPSLTHPLRVA